MLVRPRTLLHRLSLHASHPDLPATAVGKNH